ncbi:MAG: hypothetical protein GY811_00675 [Myxococcales bacterium]|nr:hypothetical protein [Myxococcales bacterium]
MPDSLAEIVIAEGLMTPSEVAQVATAADSARIPLVVPMVRELGVDEVALVVALKKHVRVVALDPAKIELDSDAPRELCLDDSRRLRALPISIGIYGAGPRLLRVAMADPTDAVSIAELEHITECTVEPVLVTLSAVEEMIESAYKHLVTEVMKRSESVRTPKLTPNPPENRPKTRPLHRIADEAGTLLRVEALVQLCVDKGLFEQSEYAAAVKALLKKK